MNDKPSLKEFLSSNPGKGLNDYFELYGNENQNISTPTPEPSPTPPPPVTTQDNTYVEQPKSYIDAPSNKKAKIDIINILASILILAGFFLPWMDMTQFKNTDDLEIVNGMDMYTAFSIFNLESFTDLSNYTIYLIIAGAAIALIGELIRNWAVRIIGQMLTFPFVIYWIYKLYCLYSHTEIHAEDLELMDYLQYGFFMVSAGALLYFIDIIRTTFGNR